MLKIKKDTSVKISLFLAIVAIVVIVAAMVTLPFIIGEVSGIFFKSLTGVIVLIYAASFPVIMADIILIRLLLLIRKSQVFTAASVGSLRGISWCCFAECLILIIPGTILLQYADWIALLLAFAVAFLGIVLRVVKNVIEEATAIKSENDFTI